MSKPVQASADKGFSRYAVQGGHACLDRESLQKSLQSNCIHPELPSLADRNSRLENSAECSKAVGVSIEGSGTPGVPSGSRHSWVRLSLSIRVFRVQCEGPNGWLIEF